MRNVHLRRPVSERQRQLVLTACAAALLVAGDAARAGNILRAGVPGSNSSSPANQASQAAAQAAQAAAQAAGLAEQTQGSLNQALLAIRQWQASQAAARAAAQQGSSKNGLGPGALDINSILSINGTPTAVIDPVTMAGSRTDVTITQNTPRAILTWNTFNVGPQTDVIFDQTKGGANAASWVSLNRVLDPSGNPSQILGSISALGQVYIINRNGVIFGGGSQVNVGSLVVSGLDIAVPGAPTSQCNAACQYANYFESQSLFQLAFAAPSNQSGGSVTVGAGSKVVAASGGRVMLLGQSVENDGAIEAPEGQVLLAAASGIAFNKNGASNGLQVESLTMDGAVENKGILSADLGNITLVAAQTNQDGLVTATTGAQANGSITLGFAGGSTTLGSGSVTQVLPDTGGLKVVGSGSAWAPSQLAVQGDQIVVADGATVYLPAGVVKLNAGMITDPTNSGVDDSRIYVGTGARIDVSGLQNVDVPMTQNSIQAQLGANELADDPLLRNNPAFHGQTIWFDSRYGVNEQVANVSGYYNLLERDVTQLMTNGGSVTLNANTVITRQGSLIDLSGGSLSYQGGYVKSSVLIAPNGNRVPIEDAVPGLAYLGIDGDFAVNHARWGVVQTFESPFAMATPQYEAGYVQGGNAGSLTVGTNPPGWYPTNPSGQTTPAPPNPTATAAFRIFDGQVKATTVAGPNQVNASTGSADPTLVWKEQPLGATLTLNNTGDVSVAAYSAPLLAATFGPTSKVDPTLEYQVQLPEGWFNGSHSAASPTPGVFGSVSISSGWDPNVSTSAGATVNRAYGGFFTLGAGKTMDLGDYGSLAFTGAGAEIDGTILAPGGKVVLSALQLPSFETAQLDPNASLGNEVHLSSTGVIDVAGRLTNQFRNGSFGSFRALNGGTVSLTGENVILDPGSLVDVSGGAEVSPAGKVTAGNGGSIAIDVSQVPIPNAYWDGVTFVPQANLGTLFLGGTLNGYAVGQGGALTIKTGYDVVIAASLPQEDTGPTYRLFTPDFFTHGGFSSYTVVGERSVTVASGTVLAPSTETLSFGGPISADGSTSLSGGDLQLSTGTRLDDVLGRQILPEVYQRKPMSLTLTTLPVATSAAGGQTSDLSLGIGAKIDLSAYPGSTVNLSAYDKVDIYGTVLAPGGSIGLTVSGMSGQGSVVLESGAELAAYGYQTATLVTHDELVRSVAPGGTISISSSGAVEIDPARSGAGGAPAAVIDVSGFAHGWADLQGGPSSAYYVATPVDGSAGSLTISAESGVVAGNLKLGPGGSSGVGGALTINRIPGAGGAVPMVVTQSALGASAGSQNLTVVADSVNASGADDLTLQTIAPGAAVNSLAYSDAILFSGNVNLQTRNSITLVAPILAAEPGGSGPAPSAVTISSHYVDLQGESVTSSLGTVSLPAAGQGTGLGSTFTIKADLIDIARTMVLGCYSADCTFGGFSTASFVSSGDVRLSDRDLAGSPSEFPGLFSAGSLEFKSAQVYVTARQESGSDLERGGDDPGFWVYSGDRISIIGNGNPAPVPQSFGERLTLEAPVIDQGGVLRAPQGQIFLTGTGPTGSVTLEAGSVTSAALGGVSVAFGPVETGGVFYGYDQAGLVPTKSVNLSGVNIAVNKGAVIDVSGGGDLQGYLFTSGNGGTQDVLSSSNGFAVVPSIGASPLPVSPVSSLSDPRLAVGDTVWLQGVPGLPDGTYTLLPSHYALLPGGYLVVPLGGAFAAPPPTTYRPDGSVVVSGYETRSGNPGYGQFVVMSQQVFDQYSQFTNYSFNQFAANLASQESAVVRTPNDAGTVVLSASQSLSLLGTGRLGGSGLLGDLDISAPDIAVLASGASAPTDGKTYVTLDLQSLENFGAGSVLIGGTRSESTTTALTVNADRVFVNTGGATWNAPEILLAATHSVTVADGSVLRASAPASGGVLLNTNPLVLQPASGSQSNDGALVRLSAGGRVPLERDGAQGVSGSLLIGTGAEGATISAAGSLSLDGSNSISIALASTLTAPQLDLASTHVNLGDAPANAPGVTLGTSELLALASSSNLLLRGYDSIEIFGSIALGSRDGSGSATLQSLTLDSALLLGHPDAAGAAQITSGTLTVQNSGSPVGPGPAESGSLTIDVDTLKLGAGNVQLAGYGSLLGKAGVLEVQGAGGLSFPGSVSLTVGQVTAASNTDYSLTVGGALDLGQGTAPASASGGGNLGGRLAVQASSISLNTQVLLPAGTFQASATGGNIEIGSNASIDVRGAKVTLEDQVEYAPGGLIELSATGDIGISSGATLNVSGAAEGGPAGVLELTAGPKNNVSIAPGALSGAAAAGYAGGSFALDAGTFSSPGGLSQLYSELSANGFASSASIRLRNQDVVVSAGDEIQAHQVILQADNGLVTVAGQIVASGTSVQPDGGSIQIEGGNGVQVLATAKLEAVAQSADAASGLVEIVADGGRLNVASGASVNVAGGKDGGGLVVVRAPRDGSDIAIDGLGATFVGARQVVLQGTASYQATTPDPSDTAASDVDPTLANLMLSDAGQWLAGSQGIIARLANGNPALLGLHLQVAPAMVVTSSSPDLTVATNVDLHGLGAPGYLGFVASGSIDVKGVVSDGFTGPDPLHSALLSGSSFSYSFQAGQDVTLEAGSMVRTGTGSITMQAGRDIVFAPPTTQVPTTAVVYTAGSKTATPSPFLGAPGSTLIGEFPTGGGDIVLQAGNDISAPMTTETTSAWLFRYGDSSWNGSAFTVNEQTSWSVYFPNFDQCLGALGGGNVSVTAGHDVSQLQVAIPTTGFLTTQPGQVASLGDLVERGGGNLTLSAGGDILGGLFVLGQGHADLRAGGSVIQGSATVGLRKSSTSLNTSGSHTIGVLFGLMDATATVTAGSEVYIEGAFDPMRQGQIAQNLVGGNTGSTFSGYTNRTSLEAMSLGGEVHYENDPWASVDVSVVPGSSLAVKMSGSGTTSLNTFFSSAPSTLQLVSLESNVWVEDQFSTKSTLTLDSSPQGTLDLLAWQNVLLPIAKIQMAEVAPEYQRGPLSPVMYQGDQLGGPTSVLVPSDPSTNSLRGFTPVHSGDPAPVLIYAVTGSVCAQQSGSCTPDANPTSVTTLLAFPKPMAVVAGQDIMAGTFEPQNNSAADVSSFVAGRNVYEPAIITSGPGSVVIQAGQDVIMNQTNAPSAGSTAPVNRGGLVISLGNRTSPDLSVVDVNAALPVQGADTYILAGAGNGVDYAGFAAAYLDPANSHNVAQTYLPELSTYMAGLGYKSQSGAALVSAFDALPLVRREIFLDQVYFNELKETGIDFNDATSPGYKNYQRGFQAASLLFPTDPSAALAPGDVILSAKPVETQSNASISILAPYGSILVGADVLPNGVDPTAGGIVTRRGGNVNLMANEDIALFTSRVFTLEGGDITMWTSNGSITAGSGSKTSVLQEPLKYFMDDEAVVSVNAFGLSTGAGIGVLDALQNAGDRATSTLDLIAPRGEVNAGDAGIRVVGNLIIAAALVVGVDNIQVTGSAVGVPKVEAPNIAGLTTASQLTQAVAQEGVGPEAAAAARSTVADLPSIITVEVVGYETPSSPGAGAQDAEKRKGKRPAAHP